GTAVAVAPSVIVRDGSGNAVSGVEVTFLAPSTANGSVTGGSQTTNGAGVAQVGAWTRGTVAGTDSLEAATSPVLGGRPVYCIATVTPGPPATISKFSGD